MTFRQFIFFITVVTILLWLGWWWTVVSIDPFTTNFIGFLLFYTTLFLSLFGSFTLIGVMIRKMRVPNVMVFHLVLLASRQAFFLATLFILLLMMQSQRWLDGWVLSAVLLLALIIEGYNLRRHRKSIAFQEKPLSEEEVVQDYRGGIPPQFERKELQDETE